MWEIYTYWNVSEIYAMLNGVASLMNNLGFFELLTLGATLGFIVSMLTSISGKGGTPLDIFKFILIGALLFNLMVLPRTTVQVVDKTGINPPMVVSNIPVGLAALASITSEVGYWMTNTFETVFSVPGDIKMEKGGSYFTMRIIEEAKMASPYAQILQYNMNEYVRECVIPDIQSGAKSIDKLRNSSDLWLDMSQPNPALMATLKRYNSSTGGDDYETMSCVLAYVEITNPLVASGNDETRRLAERMYPGLNSAAAQGALNAALPASMSYFLGASSKSASEIVKQNLTKNLFKQAMTNASTGTSAQLALAEARVESAARLEYQMKSSISESLVQMRNTIEVLAYALFPIVVISLAVLGHMGLSALGTYLKVLIWLQLWAPLYAVTSYLVAMRTSGDLNGQIAAIGGSPFSLAADPITSSGLVNALQYSQYMLFMVPVLAWMLVSVGANALGSMPAMATPRTDKPADEIGSGNNNIGNTQLGNMTAGNSTMFQHVQAPNTNIAGASSLHNSDGSISSISSVGHTVNLAGTSNQGSSFTAQTMSSIAQSATTEASKLDQAAFTMERRATQAKNQAVSHAMEQITSGSHGSTYGSSIGTGEEKAISTAASETKALQKQLVDKFGFTEKESQAAITAMMAEIGANGGISSLKGKAGAGDGIGKLIGKHFGGNLKTGTSLSANDQKILADEITKAMESTEGKVSTEDWKKTHQALEKASKGEDFKTTDGTEVKFSDATKTNIENASRDEKSASVNRQKAQALRESSSVIESAQRDFGVNLLAKLDANDMRLAEELHRKGDLGAASNVISNAIKRHTQNSNRPMIADPTNSAKPFNVPGVINAAPAGIDKLEADSNIKVSTTVQTNNGNVNVGGANKAIKSQLEAQKATVKQKGEDVEQKRDHVDGVVSEEVLKALNTVDKVDKALKDGSAVANKDGTFTFNGKTFDPKQLGLKQEQIADRIAAANLAAGVTALMGEFGGWPGKDNKPNKDGSTKDGSTKNGMPTKNQSILGEIGEKVKNTIAKGGVKAAARTAAGAAAGPAAGVVMFGGAAYSAYEIGTTVAGDVKDTLVKHGVVDKDAGITDVVKALDGLRRGEVTDKAPAPTQAPAPAQVAGNTVPADKAPAQVTNTVVKETTTKVVVEKSGGNGSEVDLFKPNLSGGSESSGSGSAYPSQQRGRGYAKEGGKKEQGQISPEPVKNNG